MNFHSDEYIMQCVQDHYNEALTYFDKDNIVGIFLQGSQNYGLDYEGSDIDTKLITTPTLEELIYNKPPVSTTHVRANEEHIDFKDIRLYFQTFVKQNLNFLEILFTPYYIINPLYADEFNRLFENKELIARMNPYTAVKSMKGIAHNKMCALKHRFEGKVDVIDKYGYDPKQISHIARVDDYLTRYIAGEEYAKCLYPSNPEYILNLKKGLYTEAEVDELSNSHMNHIDMIADEFCSTHEPNINGEAKNLLDSVQYSIMKESIIHGLYLQNTEQNK